MTTIAEKTETIHIYHTNDIHSHFDNWPGISEFLLDKRKEHEQAGESCFVFDLGDFVDRSHPFTEATKGKGNIELLNRAKYDAVTIGNNEGITLSHEALEELYSAAQFDVIVANLRNSDGRELKWAVPYTCYTTHNGVKLAVIGATAVYELFYGKLGWMIQEPRDLLVKLASDISESVDCIICLSHLGVNEDRLLAKETSDIDVILGAHTHHLFVHGEIVEDTLLAATGKFGQYVGQVTLTLENGQIVDKVAAVLPADELIAESHEIEAVQQMITEGSELLDEEVFSAPIPLKQNLFAESPLSNFFGRALLAYTKVDCGLFNAGIFLGSLAQGSVTKRDLHRVLPHPINACVLTVKGRSLRDYYEISCHPDWPRTEVRGLGFRGTMMGVMVHVNLKMIGDVLYVGEKVVDPEKEYKLATLDMFTFGFFYPNMKFEKIDYLVPELIRDIAGWYGQEEFGTTS
ncbi:bifunctional metallophosphatase/5'-nucleotidase [Sporosarcina sp. BI001-red]|uniref:bifunctional metallophosphatase/5'-nucleotidase n=1 Tax=Sporosarcina sp. BI001-red TaxID=2282866 RepID=UPI000E26C070|nr:bifunctional UDP-sugar hydrolase/5'-nucleotidase [Sporosarcina sp. BI001-red]REB04816.1 bifunctional metallophosphatase/5'-nucleotidase [Sporosarcina sp. BI001-red]